jgi:hypothetical protein
LTTAEYEIQAYVGDTAVSVPDDHSKASHANSFGFPVRMKVTFTLYCSLLSMQQHYVYKTVYIH